MTDIILKDIDLNFQKNLLIDFIYQGDFQGNSVDRDDTDTIVNSILRMSESLYQNFINVLPVARTSMLEEMKKEEAEQEASHAPTA